MTELYNTVLDFLVSMGIMLYAIPTVIASIKTFVTVRQEVLHAKEARAQGKYFRSITVGDVLLKLVYTFWPILNIFYCVGFLWTFIWNILKTPLVSKGE